jgi:hypothetical protein
MSSRLGPRIREKWNARIAIRSLGALMPQTFLSTNCRDLRDEQMKPEGQNRTLAGSDGMEFLDGNL